MKISDNIIKEHLKNVYFLCGGAYGGKTTMAKLLEEKYGMIRYRQGDRWEDYAAVANAEEQPAMSTDGDTVENTLSVIERHFGLGK